jgi:HAMP domain-containing protein
MAEAVKKRGGPWLGLLVSAALLFFAASVYIAWPMVQLRKMSQAYQRVQRGMMIDEVKTIMGRAETPGIDLAVEWFEWEHLSWDEVKTIKTQAHYQVPTLFLPVTFGFAFDAEGKLIGKHRFD